MRYKVGERVRSLIEPGEATIISIHASKTASFPYYLLFDGAALCETYPHAEDEIISLKSEPDETESYFV